MEQKLKSSTKKINRNCIPYVLIGVFFLGYYLTRATGGDDTVVIAKYGYVNSIWQHILLMKDDYLNWSSRIFINLPIHILITHKPIWAVCNTVVTLLFIYGIERLISDGKNGTYTWYVIGVLLLFPWNYLGQSGWIVTSMTYLWPATALLYWLLILKEYIQGDRTCYWKIGISILLGLYATNLEQMAVFATVAVLGLGLYTIMQKKKKPAIIVWIIVLVIAFLIHLMVPGESVRYLQEISDRFPDYMMMGIINKLDLGIATAMREFLEQINFPFLLFAFLLLRAVNRRSKEGIQRVIATIPLGMGILWPLSDSVLAGTKYDIGLLQVTDIGAIATSNCLSLKGYYYLIVVMACAICVGLSLLVAFESLEKGIVMASLFVGAYATRVMMAFSPTIWASAERTYIAMYITFLVLSLFLLEENFRECEGRKNNGFNSVLTMGAVYSLICWLL